MSCIASTFSRGTSVQIRRASRHHLLPLLAESLSSSGLKNGRTRMTASYVRRARFFPSNRGSSRRASLSDVTQRCNIAVVWLPSDHRFVGRELRRGARRAALMRSAPPETLLPRLGLTHSTIDLCSESNSEFNLGSSKAVQSILIEMIP